MKDIKTAEEISHEIARLVDQYVPADGVGTLREAVRQDLNHEIFRIVTAYHEQFLLSDEIISLLKNYQRENRYNCVDFDTDLSSLKSFLDNHLKPQNP